MFFQHRITKTGSFNKLVPRYFHTQIGAFLLKKTLSKPGLFMYCGYFMFLLKNLAKNPLNCSIT